MKKTIVSLTATIALVFTGCFIDSDTATVRINLGNLPVAKVEKKSIFDRIVMLFVKEAVAQGHPGDYSVIAVHLGAFDSNNQLLAKKTINIENYPENNIVSFDVPARGGVTIVVIGENDDDGNFTAGYYGKNLTPLNLRPGATDIITIDMKAINSTNIQLKKVVGVSRSEWDQITGAARYNIYNGDSPPPAFIQSNILNYFNHISGIYNYYLEIDFEFADIKSDLMYFC